MTRRHLGTIKTLEQWRKEVPVPPERERKAEPLEPCYVYMGKIVREMRQRLGLDQGELAEAIESNKSTVSRIEAGAVRVSLHELPALAKALRLPISSLLPPEFMATGEKQ